MAKVIGKVNLNSLNYNIASTAYATCASEAGTVAKVAYIEGSVVNEGFTVVTGITTHVLFVNGNTAANPTLSINGSGAAPIKIAGMSTTTPSWVAGTVIALTYDGTGWIINNYQAQIVDTNQKVKAGSVTFGSSDTVNFVSGSSNLTVTGNASADTITISLTGKLPADMIPGSVDEIIEGYYYNSKFYKESAHTTEITGETGKIYVDLSTNKTYRWGGSSFVEISASLALGTTASTAAKGNHTHKLASHTHKLTGAPYTPAGGVTVTPNTTTVNSITAVGSLPSLTITEATASKITAWSAGSVPTRSSFTYATGAAKSTADALTGVKITAQPTVTLKSNDTEVANSVPYISVLSVGDPSLGGTTTFNTNAIKAVGLSNTGTSTDGVSVKYVESISGSAPSLTGTKTFVTGYNSFSGGSGSLESYNAASGGTKTVANGTRVPYVTDVTHTAASLTGTKTFVTGYSRFSGGSGSLTSNTTSTNGTKYVETVGNSVSASYADGVLTFTTVSPTVKYLHHSHTAASLGTASTGTVGISGGSVTVTKEYLAHGHTAASLGTASTGTVGIKNGSYSATTKYMKTTTTAADSASVSLTAGSVTATTKYLTATASGTAVGANGTATVIKELTTSSAYQITGVGSAPSLTYEDVTVGSASDWSAGTLPTKGSNTTVVTGIKSASFSGTAATITPTIAGSGELTTGTPQ